MDIRTRLQKSPLLFDGGMGTCYAMRAPQAGECELANLNDADTILQIHREYLAAGCEAIKTNTFGANLPHYQGDTERLAAVIRAGYKLAKKAAGETAFVFADIGPVNGVPEKDAAAEYCRIADLFLEQGAENFLFETNSTDAGLVRAAEHIRQKKPNAFILVSFAAQPDGYTREGFYYLDLLRRTAKSSAVDGVGLNCVSGARHMRELLQKAGELELPLLAMPNAGYPVVLNNRTFYEGDPGYFATQLLEILSACPGVRLLGGCCGTTPAHLEKVHALWAAPRVALPKGAAAAAPAPAQAESPFWQKLAAGQKVIAVEFDPPRSAEVGSFMAGAARLQAAGADILTLADCPIACARMDSSLLACKIKRELGMEPLPHMTCRDRNLNAAKALLLGLFAEGVRNVLLVTGDPIPTAERDEVKSVYQFNSRKLARYVSSLRAEETPLDFHIFGALNLNARNFDVELGRAKEKMENGMCGFLTQPVLTEAAFLNLQHARTALPNAKILGGIIPIVSARNARYMHSEVNGILVDPAITELYEGKDRAEGEALAESISTEIARRIAPFVDGYYLITPFGRVELMERILKKLR